MPVLNGEKYLKLAIDSILDQSFKDFEFIIINDGSTDNTEEIIKSYGDKRIIYIKNVTNFGLAKSFNIGIKASQGQYIARMDADDVSILDRFQKQLTFLQTHGDIDIIGSSVVLINQSGRKLKRVYRPINHVGIKWQSLFSTPIFHPTVMAKTTVLKNNPYNDNLSNSEDYELWSRLLFSAKAYFANMNEPLLFYRTSGFTHKLNTNKRTLSAENSIRNIEHYTLLNSTEQKTLVFLRQGQSLSLSQLWTIFKIYTRAARAFCHIEKTGLLQSLSIYSKLASLCLFLIKHKIKY